MPKKTEIFLIVKALDADGTGWLEIESADRKRTFMGTRKYCDKWLTEWFFEQLADEPDEQENE